MKEETKIFQTEKQNKHQLFIMCMYPYYVVLKVIKNGTRKPNWQGNVLWLYLHFFIKLPTKKFPICNKWEFAVCFRFTPRCLFFRGDRKNITDNGKRWHLQRCFLYDSFIATKHRTSAITKPLKLLGVEIDLRTVELKKFVNEYIEILLTSVIFLFVLFVHSIL